MKKNIRLIFLLTILLLLVGCSNNSDKKFYDEYPTGDEIETVEVKENPIATIEFEDGSKVEIELYYNTAPNAVTNFIAFANEKIYNGMAFNIVRNNCIVMLGAAEGDFVPPYYVMDEINSGENKLSHKAGVVSMIRESKSNTLTGQFFVLTEDQTHFDSNFTSFGVVTSGMDVFEKIAASEKDKLGNLDTPYIVKSISVKTFGVKFPNPTIIPIEEEN